MQSMMTYEPEAGAVMAMGRFFGLAVPGLMNCGHPTRDLHWLHFGVFCSVLELPSLRNTRNREKTKKTPRGN
jgi:hypothetical protein